MADNNNIETTQGATEAFTNSINALDEFIEVSIAPETKSSRDEDTSRRNPIKKRQQSRRRPVANKYTINRSEQSVLLNEIDREERPYSQEELKKNRQQLWGELNLSRTWITHDQCGHAYYVKMNGQKFKEVQEKNTNVDVGNCSVCWKLRRTPRYLANRAHSLVKCYGDVFGFQQNNNNYLVFEDSQIEKIYYVWLYLEYYDNNFRI